MQKIVLGDGRTQMVNTDFGTNPNAAVSNMILQNQLTESMYMGRIELDTHHSFGKNITRAGVYLENIKTNWETNLQACSFTPSQEMMNKFNEYYIPMVEACRYCNEMAINHDVDSSQLIKHLTLQGRVVTISHFILGLKNDYNRVAMKMRVLNEDQVNTALYLSKNDVLNKISQGRFNELVTGDMEALQKTISMTEQRAENTIMMLFYSEILAYLTMHYSEVMQTLQNLAHMPTENGQGLLVALGKVLWMDDNKALLYKAQMSEVVMDYNSQNPNNGDDINVIGERALKYMQQGMNTENAYMRARQEIANERNTAMNNEMGKHHDQLIKSLKITNPEQFGIPSGYNSGAVGITPITPGGVTLGLGANSVPGMTPGIQQQFNYAPPVQMGTQMGAGGMMPYQAPVQQAPVVNIPGAVVINYQKQPLFPNGVPNVNNMQQNQQVYNNNGTYVPVNNGYNPMPQNDGVVNINGVLCKEVSPGSGTYVAISQAAKVPNAFDAMYPNGIM